MRPGSTVSAVSPVGVPVAVATPDALVAAGAERPSAVPGRRTVASEQHAADVGGHAGVIERPVQLIDGLGPKGVAHLGAVEGDADRALIDRPVIGDVREIHVLHRAPGRRVEQLRNHRISSSDTFAGAPGDFERAAGATHYGAEGNPWAVIGIRRTHVHHLHR